MHHTRSFIYGIMLGMKGSKHSMGVMISQVQKLTKVIGMTMTE